MFEGEKLSLKKDGFNGIFYNYPDEKEKCLIVLSGDTEDDFLSRAFAKYFFKKWKCSVISMSLSQKEKSESGLSLFPLESVEKASSFAKERNFSKLGICGISMQAVIALVSSAFIDDISLVIAFSPCDFIPWGFYKGKIGKDNDAEYPSGESLFSYKGKALPFHESGMEKEEYWARFKKDTKKFKEMHSKGVFEESEKRNSIKESEFIKAENIKGRIVLIASEDDSMWNSCRYTKRMLERIKEKNPSSFAQALIYKFGTHLLLPSDLIKTNIPLFGNLIYLMFSSGRKNFSECRKSSVKLNEELKRIQEEW